MRQKGPGRVIVHVSMPKPLFDKVSKVAKDDRRTISFMVQELTEQGLIRRGQLDAKEAR